MKKLLKILFVSFVVIALMMPTVISYAASQNRERERNVAVQNGSSGFAPMVAKERIRDRIRLRTSEAVQEIRKSRQFVVSGKVVSLSESSITLIVSAAGKKSGFKKGDTVTFAITESTKITGLKKVSELTGELLPETRATVIAVFDQNSYVAKTVKIHPPKQIVLTGRIAKVSDSEIAVLVKTSSQKNLYSGKEIKVIIKPATRITYPASVEPVLKEGLYVTVIGYSLNDSVLAKKIVVKAKPTNQTTETTTPPAGNDTTETTSVTTQTPETTETSGTTQTTQNASDGIAQSVVTFFESLFAGVINFIKSFL